VAIGDPRYVSRVDPLANTITLARRADLETRTFDFDEASFVAGAAPDEVSFRALVQVRHRAQPVAATVRRDERSVGCWSVEADAAVWAAAPGQACVLYDPGEPDVVLGGGRIVRPPSGP